MTVNRLKDQEALSEEAIEGFLDSQREKGLGQASLETYRRNLRKLYQALPEGKRITGKTGAAWKRQMEAEGLSPRSINARLSAFNSLCAYLGRREFQMQDFLESEKAVAPELTRVEYLRLLQAAKLLEKERTYLLIKVLGSAGLRIQELPQLTAEAAREGTVSLRYHNDRCQRMARLPRGLQEELLDFSCREGIREGPIFRAAGGGPVPRTYIYKLLQAVSRAAHVDSEKATPHCLWNMYQNTRDTILSSIALLADQAYDRLLEEEQQAAGWERPGLPVTRGGSAAWDTRERNWS